MDQAFRDAMAAGYASKEATIVLGSPIREGEVAADVRVQVALSILNRHGLIAGATGTGKTKTLQVMAGQLSKAGVPVFIADIKGDLTGLAAPGDGTNPKVIERCASLAWTFEPTGHPVEFLSLSGKLGAQVRATVHSFGPLLLGRVLGLNDTQTSVLSLVFKYCDDNALPLLDLPDLMTTLKFLGSDEGKVVLADYGGIAPATLGVILRAIITLEQQGADVFFGEPEFDVMDLIRTGPDGLGIVSVLELSDVMDKPALFSTFMLWMLAQLYHVLPEAGDLPRPKLCFFFDEAHLLFNDASSRPPPGGRADGPADPLEGGRGLLRDPGPDRHPGLDPGPAREPGRARPSGVHPAGRRQPPEDGPDLPDDRLLRRREDDHLAGNG